MYYYQSIPVIGNFFQITFIENPGMAFGLQIGGKLFLSIFTIFATLLILYFIWKNRHESLYLRTALAFIFGGAIGNLIDRIFYGAVYGYAPLFYGNVVDFFHVDFPDFTIFGKTFHSWPIFNVADIAVSVGFVLILIGHKKIFALPEDKIVKDNSDTESISLDESNSQVEISDSVKTDESNPITQDDMSPDKSASDEIQIPDDENKKV